MTVTDTKGSFLSVANGADTEYDSSAITQQIPAGLCPDANYNFSISHQISISLASPEGSCQVTFGLDNQDISTIGNDGSGPSSPYPSQYQRDSFEFQYIGAADDAVTPNLNDIVISLFCYGVNTMASYTIDDISIVGPRCQSSSPCQLP